MEIWPAILVTGVSFAVPQFLISNFVNPWIVDIGASLISMACLIVFPQDMGPAEAVDSRRRCAATTLPLAPCRSRPNQPAQSPPPPQVWMSLSALDHRLRDPASLGHKLVQGVKSIHGRPGIILFPSLHNMITKVPPIVARRRRKAAVFGFTWLSYTGSGMLIAAIISGLLMGFSPVALVGAYGRTIKVLRLFAGHHLGDARDRNLDQALRHRRHVRAGLRCHRRALSLLRYTARLARRRADRLGYGVECPVRQPAEDHSEQLGVRRS